MKTGDICKLRVLSKTEPSIAQTYAEKALEMANELPETFIEVPMEKGIEKGLIVPVREGVFKLVGIRGLERE